jgi:hypothetical protein
VLQKNRELTIKQVIELIKSIVEQALALHILFYIAILTTLIKSEYSFIYLQLEVVVDKRHLLRLPATQSCTIEGLSINSHALVCT